VDLHAIDSGSLVLDNRDFDTGLETKAGEYSLTDLTYSDLLAKLSDEHFAQVTPELRANVLAFYANPSLPAFARKSPGKWQKTISDLEALKAATSESALKKVVPN
jgi:hypothetical protein